MGRKAKYDQVTNRFDLGLGRDLQLAKQKAQSHPDDAVRVVVADAIQEVLELCARVGLEVSGR